MRLVWAEKWSPPTKIKLDLPLMEFIWLCLHYIHNPWFYPYWQYCFVSQGGKSITILYSYLPNMATCTYKKSQQNLKALLAIQRSPNYFCCNIFLLLKIWNIILAVVDFPATGVFVLYLVSQCLWRMHFRIPRFTCYV